MVFSFHHTLAALRTYTRFASTLFFLRLFLVHFIAEFVARTVYIIYVVIFFCFIAAYFHSTYKLIHSIDSVRPSKSKLAFALPAWNVCNIREFSRSRDLQGRDESAHRMCRLWRGLSRLPPICWDSDHHFDERTWNLEINIEKWKCTSGHEASARAENQAVSQLRLSGCTSNEMREFTFRSFAVFQVFFFS